MAKGSRNVGRIRHPTHPHTLQFIYRQSEYVCDGCKESGYGFRYRCPNSAACDFDLHESCARAPQSIIHSFHPQHNIALFTSSSNATTHVCDICGKDILGFRYCCHTAPCNVCIHPACAHLPNEVTHALHPQHRLQIIRVDALDPIVCEVCGKLCSDCMAYCCAAEDCNFKLHIACAKLPVDPLQELRMQSMEMNDAVEAAEEEEEATGDAGGCEGGGAMSGVQMQLELLKIQQRLSLANSMNKKPGTKATKKRWKLRTIRIRICVAEMH